MANFNDPVCAGKLITASEWNRAMAENMRIVFAGISANESRDAMEAASMVLSALPEDVNQRTNHTCPEKPKRRAISLGGLE